MTELEYQILDELYFIISFDELVAHTHLSAEEASKILWDLWTKKWIRILQDHNTEISPSYQDFFQSYRKYYFFASKEGLLAHNSR